MAVVREFTLPDLGEGLTEATIVQWLVEVGEVVAVDQPVVEVETAKAMVEVPCPYGGVVTARYGDEGVEVPVGTPLVTVAVGAVPDDLAERAPTTGAANGTATAPETPAADAAENGSGNVLVGYGTSAAAARRRRIRPADGARPETGGPQPPTGAEPATPAEETAADRPARAADADGRTVPVISPLVRRMARENDLDLREVTGTGPDGLILRTDVESALRVRRERAPQPATAAVPAEGTVPAGATAAPGAAPGVAPTAGEERIPLRGMLGAAAEKFSRSRREIPEATCWVDADATELLAVRRAMNVPGAPKVSLLALLARITTAALARFPQLNATVDTRTQEIVRLPAVHLGFAAQTDRGLVVPVVRDAQARTVEDLSAEMARLTETARAGGLSLAELTHGTFTLNNYGVFGVDGSTPIINHPEAAMLGVGRIAAKPWVHDGELAVRQVVQLSLTFDHRVCDGGTAGGFLRYVADCVERPALLLRGL
ncbi:dihydrolipoamide acetyltransferase component of pyruvate dehydrogenase complex [Streptomyces nigrescens]|uniref:Dihydrolipoamide acetyltransferase component of pyruvate dehydrogenase complex n=1 Tax=Streptomyces nigrescens TaxID=1920 RepID=A0ABN6R8X5_STRNI|nr:dihydrolipoamide acetyltransferase family protein [Streptomyces nigrescens]BDM73535.1 dihydrolipoamide acetyltransferase component of pyruvate dehydrogenase complex [Streptomyces nigrescens]